MAEQVNQRIEDMINELEQMRRTGLYTDEEIKEISRRRKEFEYKVQRHVKEKEDYVQYIAYELALIEDIAIRRQQHNLGEKKKDMEYAIVKRLNRLFKQFIYRFQNDVSVYFEYIKFCTSVGFDSAVSGIIGQMLQMHGDKPKMWQLAAKWEIMEKKNLDAARTFLIKGIHRHPESDILYMDLFEIELTKAFKAKEDEEKEKQLNRATVIWKNGAKNVTDINFLFKLCDISMKFDVEDITKEIKDKIWENSDTDKKVWSYMASLELSGINYAANENDDGHVTKRINKYVSLYEEALQKFPDKNLFREYIHGLLGVDDEVWTANHKISTVQRAWMYGHENGVLTDDMYVFGVEMFKLENEKTTEELIEILDEATKVNPQSRIVWEEKLKLYKSDEKKLLELLEVATKALKPNEALHLWNLVLEYVQSKEMLQNLYKRFRSCENSIVMSIKPKLLQKMYDHTGLKAARDMYQQMIRAPPTQIELHKIMINIERSQEKPNIKNIRNCYECAVQHHGANDVQLWIDYMKFEVETGSVQASPAIYRRAVATLKKQLVDEFIKAQTLNNLK